MQNSLAIPNAILGNHGCLQMYLRSLITTLKKRAENILSGFPCLQQFFYYIV